MKDKRNRDIGEIAVLKIDVFSDKIKKKINNNEFDKEIDRYFDACENFVELAIKEGYKIPENYKKLRDKYIKKQS